ncbi:MAG: aminopeptidase P family protein [Spirochaetales bacterium]
MTIAERLGALRRELHARGLAAWVVTSTDPHDSEYTPERWETRQWISGFTGSAGLVVVTADAAALWTDGRYFLQAEAELKGSGIALMKEQQPETPSPMDWLKSLLHRGAVVGTDALTVMHARLETWRGELAPAGITLKATDDVLDTLWTDRPALPAHPVLDYQALVGGLTPRKEKLAALRRTLVSRGAGAHVVTALDEIAWLLNLRGSDIAYNPVFLAWVWVEADSCTLFTDASRLERGVLEELTDDGVTVKPYHDLFDHSPASTLTPKVLVSPERTNEALHQVLTQKLVSGNLVHAPSLLARPKACKTPGELDLIRTAHLKDAAALANFLAWFDATVSAGHSRETELTASDKLLEFRRAQAGFRGESFTPIPGWRDNGAIIHFHLTPGQERPLTGQGLFLLDTGAQYTEGTTDLTRTLLVGPALPEEIEDYTLVLKAHIQLALTPFPAGTRGYSVDAFARRVLWKKLRNYGHGTGHGVGQYLSVHEGPPRVNAEPVNVILEPGMLLSNEPGLYRPGKYGIRLENLLVVTAGPKNEFGAFLGWETVSFCPFERRLIDVSLLEDDERAWLDAYHAQVLALVSPLVDAPTRAWLEAACKQLVDN